MLPKKSNFAEDRDLEPKSERNEEMKQRENQPTLSSPFQRAEECVKSQATNSEKDWDSDLSKKLGEEDNKEALNDGIESKHNAPLLNIDASEIEKFASYTDEMNEMDKYSGMHYTITSAND